MITLQERDELFQQIDKIVKILKDRGISYFFLGDDYVSFASDYIKWILTIDYPNINIGEMSLVMENVKGFVYKDWDRRTQVGDWSIKLSWLLDKKFQGEFENSLTERILKGMFT
jgi:hypothetical protein